MAKDRNSRWSRTRERRRPVRKPWLDYTGQKTADLLACQESHRIDSLICAFEWGIQAKEAQKKKLSPEERLVLAVKALDREVNNGGFDQFLTNSSKRYAGEIVDALRTIGAKRTADLVAEALAFARLSFKKRQAAFAPFEERFFNMSEME